MTKKGEEVSVVIFTLFLHEGNQRQPSSSEQMARDERKEAKYGCAI